MDILHKIIQHKKQEVVLQKEKETISDLEKLIKNSEKPRNFLASIIQKHKDNEIAIIAEIKKASPSKGLIRENFHPKEIAIAYEKGGATCLSILTDEQFFQGKLCYIKEVKEVVSLPILRKDFIVDEYQIYQARAYGADAILLIASSLNQQQLETFETLAHHLDLAVLVEIHDKEELLKTQNLSSPLFGVNNRNLKNFTIDLQQTIDLLPLLKEKIVVTESGIKDHRDIIFMKKNNIYTFLIGESLMKQKNLTQALQTLQQS